MLLPLRSMLLMILLLILATPAAGQPFQGPSRLPGTYPVGFKVINTYDASRAFDTTRTDSLRFKPVKIDLFYPAESVGFGRPLPYGYFLNLYAHRIDFSLPADSCQQEGEQLAQYFSSGLALDSAEGLLTLPTRCYQAIASLQGSFPLVVYFPGYNGMSYENLLLLEQLASHGYIVASVSSVGKYPGYMTMDPVDILEQVEDGSFALHYLQHTGIALPGKVAALGYSWGGLAAAIFSMRTPVSALVSLDGSDRYSYGGDSGEDEQYSLIRQADYFRPGSLSAPYLYLSSGREQRQFVADSVFVLASATRATRKEYIRFPGTSHEDFSCLPLLAASLDSVPRKGAVTYPFMSQLVISWLQEWVKEQGSFTATRQQIQRQDTSLLSLTAPVVQPAKDAASLVLQGMVRDGQGKALPYVNIGVAGGSQGTVSQADGSFHLSLKGIQRTDTLRFSRIGFQSQSFSLAQLSSRTLQITLLEQPQALPEVVVKATRPDRRILGNATESRFFSAGFGSDQLGAQVGIPIRARKVPMLLEQVSFHLSYNQYDSLTIRLNIYRLQSGMPTQNLLTENLLLKLGKQTGRMVFDLSRNPVPIQEDVLVALELVAGQGDQQRVFLSAGMLNGATYYRRASQGAWRRSKGIGVGIQVTVQLLND